MSPKLSKLSALAIALIGFTLPVLFQNCSGVSFKSGLTNSKVTTTSIDNCTEPNCDDIGLGIAKCTFDGNEIPSGGSVTAYISSSGATCISEVRLCTNGSLSGTYTFASCTPVVPQSCLFNGQTVAHLGTVVAFQNSNGPCNSETRSCDDGVLSGSYAFASCAPTGPQACLFNGATITSGSIVTAYQNSSVPFGEECASEVRLCTDGSFNGSFAFPSCTVGAPQTCLFNGTTIAHQGTVTAFQNSTVPFGSTCSSEVRTCTNGALSGTFTSPNCNVAAPATCDFNGVSLAHGQIVRAFVSSTVPFGDACVGQDRTCENGVLSGTYAHPSCNVDEPATCTFNGTTLASGQKVLAFQSSSVAYGATCSSEERFCVNGALSGSFGFSTCSAQAPKACSFNGQTVAHGTSVNAYATSTVPYDQTCTAVVRTCNDGTLSGSAAFASCAVATPQSCLIGGKTVVHGDTIKIFKTSTVPYGALCETEDRKCTDGILSGSATHMTCTTETPHACTSPWHTAVAHGASITAYTSASVNYGQTCTAQVRSCSNGVLSGSATHQSCSPQTARNCTAPWGATVAHGATVNAFAAATVAFGQSCTASSRTCNDGTLSGSGSFASCSPAAPKACTSPWNTAVAHGSSVTAYLTSSVNFGLSCSAQVRSCNNGVLSGSAIHKTCGALPPKNCTAPWGGTVAHGSSITAYLAASVNYGAICSGQVRSCNNGVLSGSATNKACSALPPKNCTAPWGAIVAHDAVVTAYASSSVPYGSSCASQNRGCRNGVLGGTYANRTCTVLPPDRRWIQTTGATETHAAACARAGMTPSTNQGYGICASGEARPQSGYGYNSISYVHGVWGADFTGGVTITHIPQYTGTGGMDSQIVYTGANQYFCYRSGQKMDFDRTDIVVAYLCKN